MSEILPYHIKIAAEAFAAGLLTHAGYDVLIQYEANQPDYDLAIGKRNHTLTRISVKGTQLAGWTLAGRYVREANYIRAADEWMHAQSDGLIFFLVSFYEVPLGTCPDCFVATPQEIAQQLKSQRGGLGHGSLALKRSPKRGAGAGTIDAVPETWRFSLARMNKLMGV
jgi:hypothetical protein